MGLLQGARARLVLELRLFFTALQFFTRLPVPAWVGYQPEWMHQSARYYPLVGAVVGALASVVLLAASLWWPPLVAVMLSMV
ncbi:MAG TPA: adenosylcobinamide-GDP ribazoletransferase, partial [Aquabacterium sp.]|nr:adenosylcobinamide-GDP ribazoletransferase [Aquabacterium sp.]